jgi:hypothetical protein
MTVLDRFEEKEALAAGRESDTNEPMILDNGESGSRTLVSS